MAAGWLKSLQCKDKAVNDVVETQHHLRLLPSSSSCRKSFHSLNDVVETKKRKPTNPTELPSRVNNNNINRNPGSRKQPDNITRVKTSNALTELPVGHPSRNVVEIIFHTSWSPKVFSGRVEMVFKVQNSGRTVTRFEEYRELVKSGSGSGHNGFGEDYARCVADGNEVLRFQCLWSTDGYDTDDGVGWAFKLGKGAALCMFSGSGVAHESAGGGRGRKAMLVCRVIAGRVQKRDLFGSVYSGRVGYDSVSGENGELFVFDSNAVLPCFLIIFKL
ncbi:uncharacterized protein LOC143563565 [Bidens hawaiensis]|uniref:uncharacterized protein LOC143563565 n=1 Tax=Bidens hawaiensis TaxID=980011 RepID=UPI004049A8FD